MRKLCVFLPAALGWLMLMLALIFAVVRDVGLDPQRWFDLQMEADILHEAGISEGDLLQLDARMAAYLAGNEPDLNLQLSVFGQMQPAFNQRELQHMQDCRKLFAPVVNPWLNLALAAAGMLLALYGRHRGKLTRGSYALGCWCASALILLPLGALAAWAVLDFFAAFTLFHKLLFTNDLWLLNPETDLLIRICPNSMFMRLGVQIGLRCAAVLLGLPALITVLLKLDKRKRKQA